MIRASYIDSDIPSYMKRPTATELEEAVQAYHTISDQPKSSNRSNRTGWSDSVFLPYIYSVLGLKCCNDTIGTVWLHAMLRSVRSDALLDTLGPSATEEQERLLASDGIQFFNNSWCKLMRDARATCSVIHLFLEGLYYIQSI
jgi:hypothetical protein